MHICLSVLALNELSQLVVKNPSQYILKAAKEPPFASLLDTLLGLVVNVAQLFGDTLFSSDGMAYFRVYRLQFIFNAVI